MCTAKDAFEMATRYMAQKEILLKQNEHLQCLLAGGHFAGLWRALNLQLSCNAHQMRTRSVSGSEL